MLSDLRLGLRLFLRRPGLAVAAVLSLALGIGANTAIFSVLHNVVLNPLPYDDPERLMIVWETSADNPERWVAPANFVDWRRDSRAFASLAAFDEFAPTLSGRGEPERLRALGASGTLFHDARRQRRSRPHAAALGRRTRGAPAWRCSATGCGRGCSARRLTRWAARCSSTDGSYTIVGVMPARLRVAAARAASMSG